MKYILTVFLALAALSLQAQTSVRPEAPTVKASLCPTNTFLLTTNDTKLITVRAYNHSAADVYLMVCLTNAAPAANFPPLFIMGPVFAGLSATYNFPATRPIALGATNQGWGVYICASTTPASFTNSAGAVSLDITHYGKAN
jgi:hypothetical protein